MVVIREPGATPWVATFEETIAQHPDRPRWEGFRVVAAVDAPHARRILDMIPRALHDRTVVLLEQAGRPRDHWDLLDAGVGDVLCHDDVRVLEAVLARLERWATVDATLETPLVRNRFVGSSPAQRSALRELVELAMFGRAPILLVGETGTGKELAARLVHDLTAPASSGGADAFVVVDCTTIVPSLSGSELFGHERGAFTGADRARIGAVKQADGGTLFLDEVGDLPNQLQAEMLRVIQEGRFKTVGGTAWGTTLFRLVSATHRDLARDQRRGRFRSDLYHRLAAGTVRLPPLRERLADAPHLFAHFLAQARGGRTVELSPGVCESLCERDYPGNVRQLRQLALQVAARHVVPGPVTVGDIPPAERPHRTADPPTDPARKLRALIRQHLRNGLGLQDIRAMVSDMAVEIALAEAAGNTRQAAERLGVTPRALQLRRQHA